MIYSRSLLESTASKRNRISDSLLILEAKRDQRIFSHSFIGLLLFYGDFMTGMGSFLTD